jgi:hypothetical protein
MRDWIERIGWDRFFKKAGIKVGLKHIDGYLYGDEFARSDLRFGW